MMPDMESHAVKKRLIALLAVFAFLALPVALAVVGGWSLWQERQNRRVQEAEFSEALRQSLERAADVVLPVPTLSTDAVTVEVAPAGLESELQRVIRLAKGVGGSASSWNDGSSVRIIANIPTGSATLFRESVARGVYDLASAGDHGPMTVVEVLIKPRR